MTHSPSEHFGCFDNRVHKSYGIKAGRHDDGWWGSIYLPTTYGASGRSMSGGTLWDLVKFFVVPTRYYVWKYKRERGNRS